MDIITYCTDTQALIEELKEKYPDYVSEGNFLIDKTPIVRNDNETMTLIRISQEQVALIAELKNLTILGTYEEVFADSSKKEIYDRVYPLEYSYTSDEGTEETGVKPEKFCEFA